MHYRYEVAVLTGSRFTIWLAKTLGVKTKIITAKLSEEEAAKLGLKPVKTEIELPPGMNK